MGATVPKFNADLTEAISLSQAAEYAGCSRSCLWRALTDGSLRAFKCGNRWLTTRDEVDKYFKHFHRGRGQLHWLNKQQRVERGAKIRANWTCRRCGAHGLDEGERYEIYYRDWNRENQTPDNMIVLCRSCHWFAIKHYHPQQLVLPGMELPDWIR